jgi:hypothetical protein
MGPLTHLLVDLDSKIPNLALMKISAFYKKKSVDKVLLWKVGREPEPEGIFESAWISCVFKWNRGLAERIASELKKKCLWVHIGGSGWDLHINLPKDIEWLQPDYSLYGDDRAIGFVQRGCIRACDFCDVHEKEGWLKDNVYWPLEYWVPEGFSKILLLDNEFAAMRPPWLETNRHDEILDTCKERGWKLSITQGYDLRTICQVPGTAEKLAQNKPWDLKFTQRTLYCAWDYFAIEPEVRRALTTLKKAGFEGKNILCYCLSGHNTSHFQDLYRVHSLWKDFGVRPFVMKMDKRRDDPFLNALARYANRGPAAYRNHDFLDYLQHYGPRRVLPEAETIMGKIWDGEHPGFELSKT